MTKVIGHRGASADAPENTLSSVEEAFKQQADGVEIDIRLSADNKIICLHDKNTRRTTEESLLAQETSYEELSKLDAGSWKGIKWKGEKIPLLRDVLSSSPSKKEVFIEIKVGVEIVEPLILELSSSKRNLDTISIISFNPEVIKETKIICKEVTANLLVCFDPEVNIENDLAESLHFLHADGVGAQNHLKLDERFIQNIQATGKKVHVWTVNDIDEAKRYEELGIDSITTNKPKVIKKGLNKWNLKF